MKLKAERQKEIASNLEKEEQTRQLKEERRKKFEEMFAIKVKEWNRSFMKANLKKSESEKSFPKVSADKIDENFKVRLNHEFYKFIRILFMLKTWYRLNFAQLSTTSYLL